MAMPASSASSSEEDSSSVASATWQCFSDLEMWDTPMDKPMDETSDSCSEEHNPQGSLRNFLQHWALQHQIQHSALDDLLVGLKANGHPELPSTARTLLSTPRDIRSTTVSGMEYVHFGLRRTLEGQLNQYPGEALKKINTLELSLNIDGLPLFKSSKISLWPVLCAIHLTPTRIFPVTLTSGPSKPKDLDFLNDVVAEVQDLLVNGIQGKKVLMRCVVCDAPAKAMVKAIKLCTGYNGCDKCTQKGLWVDGRVTYPEVQNTLRTNEMFRREMAAKETEGLTVSPFLQLPIDMIKMFSIDYMHQACLGVMRKLLVEWVRGNRQVRLSAGQVQEVSRRLACLRKSIPSCFTRKPRDLEEVDRWKATELRQFALYTGKIVLKDILSSPLYKHFMTFSVALNILVSPNLARKHADYSRSLMVYFVSKTAELYGRHFMVYNVHAMLHLTDEAETFGCLDACSAFRFENYLGQLKRLVRSGRRPLIQVAKRLSEIERCQSRTIPAQRRKISRPNNAYILEGDTCCEVIEERKDMVLCNVFEKLEPLFTDPCDSRITGCFRVKKRDCFVKLVPACELTRQAIMIEEPQTNIFLTVLHDF